MEDSTQRLLPLLQRIDAPSAVPPGLLRSINTYRDACRVCRAISSRRHLTWAMLADECGLVPQHVGDYFMADDLPRRRSLPAEKVAAVERAYGNTAITQWLASRVSLTVIEEVQAEAFALRAAA